MIIKRCLLFLLLSEHDPLEPKIIQLPDTAALVEEVEKPGEVEVDGEIFTVGSIDYTQPVFGVYYLNCIAPHPRALLFSQVFEADFTGLLNRK